MIDCISSIKDKLSKTRANLTSVGEKEPLNRFSLAVILLLDLFILFALFQGLDEHTAQLTSPGEYIPDTCRDIVIQENWVDVNRIDRLSAIILSSHRSYVREEPAPTKDLHPVCAMCVTKLEDLKKDRGVITLLEARRKLRIEKGELVEFIDEMKGAYDTQLLKKIAGQPAPGDRQVATIRKLLDEKTIRLNTVVGRMASLEKEINGNRAVMAFWLEIESPTNNYREKLRGDLRTLNFWHPVKKLLMQMLFLLPLLVIFYIWNSRSIKKSRGIQTLISSHILIVLLIPVLLKLFEMLYDIIPHRLFKKVWDLLVSLNLIALWHYLVILISVFGSLLLIYFIQKKLFSRERTAERRIAQGACQECGKKLPAGASACPFCGFVQVKACPACGRPTHVNGKFCRECGAPAGAEKK
ncbi:MAG TPA: zinc ribbon domain-containing protein [Spirochaetota bacterium]|nr:zinc ribbon domain-containing protein [Spirochaetota bacterium]